jgi:type III pantothenate kinase
LVVDGAALKDFKTLYRSPRQLGCDRLVSSYAASRLYGQPAIIVDVGTAITWDAVDAAGKHLGGAIAPGPLTMAKALNERTALLPLASFKRARTAIGRDTLNSIESGLYWGTIGMVREMTTAIAKEVKGRPVLVITGGLAGHIGPYFKNAIIDQLLIYKGLNLILQKKEEGEWKKNHVN